MKLSQVYQLFNSDDWKDKIILELLRSLSTHPDYLHHTSSLVYQIHLAYAGLPSMEGVKKRRPDDISTIS